MKKGYVEAWRLFDRRGNDPCTLFHGVNGSRVLPLNASIAAVKRMVTNPGKKGSGRQFMAGFHVCPTRQECVDYLKRFKRDRIVCRVLVKGLRDKPGSKIKLADHMIIIGMDWHHALLGLEV